MWWCNVFLASGFVRERVTLGDARLAAGLVFPAPMSSLSFFFLVGWAFRNLVLLFQIRDHSGCKSFRYPWG